MKVNYKTMERRKIGKNTKSGIDTPNYRCDNYFNHYVPMIRWDSKGI
jgi:hypothetical protein